MVVGGAVVVVVEWAFVVGVGFVAALTFRRRVEARDDPSAAARVAVAAGTAMSAPSVFFILSLTPRDPATGKQSRERPDELHALA